MSIFSKKNNKKNRQISSFDWDEYEEIKKKKKRVVKDRN